MKIRGIIAVEGIFIFLLAMLGIAADYALIKFLNFVDKSSWTWHVSGSSALWNAGVFIVCGYVFRLAGRTLKIILGAVFAVAVIALLIFIKLVVKG